MRIGWTYNPPRSIVLTSWKSANDPSPGDFTLGLDNPEFPQLVLGKKSTKLSRWGPWEGIRFSGFGIGNGNEQIFYTPLYVNQSEVCFGFDVWHEDDLVRLQMTHFGKVQMYKWNYTNWIQLMTSNKNFCDNYSACGPYEICHNEEPHCRCLEGFDPNNSLDRASGCTRKIRRKCDAGDNFVMFTGLNLPDNAVVWPDLNASQCEKNCLEECKCNAYSYYYQNGTKCVVWLGDLVDLVDMGDIPNIWGELHVRMAQDKPANFTKAWVPPSKIYNKKKNKKKNLIVVVAVSSICVLVLSVLLSTCWSRMRNTRRLDRQRSQQRNWSSNEDDNFDFRLFEVETISVATNDFSDANKIGEGGFGPVYKGVLHNGREIAVKRLSSSSRQGQEQFENESGLIARLQHRNLVKLLGCCVHGEERMIVYEYLANQSLDKFIFDQAKRVLLTWDTRLDIILGVAKGLAYLHDDSGLTIVHRDLKASNILLDNEMIPKISDFGLAKISGDDNESNERAIYGTYGYLSPEYAMTGQFSTRSDVFGFGVLVLEIISGKKNWGFRHPDHDMNLLGHAWNLWREGKALEMMDPALGDLSFGTEILRCIQVGLLCAQHNPDQRPTMPTVVFMLMNETMALPEPTVPGFFPQDSMLSGTSGFIRPLSVSFNGLTVTTLNAR